MKALEQISEKTCAPAIPRPPGCSPVRCPISPSSLPPPAARRSLHAARPPLPIHPLSASEADSASKAHPSGRTPQIRWLLCRPVRPCVEHGRDQHVQEVWVQHIPASHSLPAALHYHSASTIPLNLVATPSTHRAAFNPSLSSPVQGLVYQRTNSGPVQASDRLLLRCKSRRCLRCVQRDHP